MAGWLGDGQARRRARTWSRRRRGASRETLLQALPRREHRQARPQGVDGRQRDQLRRARPRACRHPGRGRGEVLTLAYANADALQRTRETGELHLWSRSRNELWHKGATSGNTQAVKALRYDCDADALLALVEPAGPACHTGERTCFHRGDLSAGAARGAARAGAHARARAAERPEGSYTGRAARQPAADRREGEEEAEEVARAAREETDERVDNEAADVLYHLPCCCARAGCALADAAEVLREPPPLTPPSALRDRAVAGGGPRRSRASTTSSRCATRSSTTARRRSPRS